MIRKLNKFRNLELANMFIMRAFEIKHVPNNGLKFFLKDDSYFYAPVYYHLIEGFTVPNNSFGF